MINKKEFSSNASLKEAKDYLRENWDKGGAICPCCTQVVKLYHRPISSSMAHALILIYKYLDNHPDMEWVHMNNYLNTLDLPLPVKSGDNAKLRYWGLIEEKKEMREDTSKRAGYWKLTELGRQFVEGKTGVQQYAKIFGSKCYGLAGEHIGIEDALGKKFNYKELMEL